MLYLFCQQEEEHDNEIPLPEKLSSVDNIRVRIEDLDDYFQQKRGSTGIPLAAYTREDVALPAGTAEDPDPGFGTPSILEELIQRAPHIGVTFKNDNEMVWDAVRHVCHEGPAWGWVQAYNRGLIILQGVPPTEGEGETMVTP